MVRPLTLLRWLRNIPRRSPRFARTVPGSSWGSFRVVNSGGRWSSGCPAATDIATSFGSVRSSSLRMPSLSHGRNGSRGCPPAVRDVDSFDRDFDCNGCRLGSEYAVRTRWGKLSHLNQVKRLNGMRSYSLLLPGVPCLPGLNDASAPPTPVCFRFFTSERYNAATSA